MTPPKVFGLGLSRTGTTSLTIALQTLGHQALHFPSDGTTQSEIYAFFASETDSLRLTVADHYAAITDTPVCCTFKALDQAYPGSKFILTIRDKASWLASCENHWHKLLPHLFATMDPAWTRYAQFINTRVYGIAHYDRDVFSEVYDMYHANVFHYFRHRLEDLLVLDICGGQGWEHLASWLGSPVPQSAFPVENPRMRSCRVTRLWHLWHERHRIYADELGLARRSHRQRDARHEHFQP